MKWFRHFGIIALLLVSGVAPVLACMRADAALSAPERACCHRMQGQCGPMKMPASHTCCQNTLSTTQDNAVRSKTVVLHPVFVFVSQIQAIDCVPSNTLSTSWMQAPQYPPPESPPPFISVLRV